MSFLINYTQGQLHFINALNQECKSPGHQVNMVTKFCMIMPEVYGSSIWNLLHGTLLAPTILRWFLDVLKICAPLLFIPFSCHITDRGT